MIISSSHSINEAFFFSSDDILIVTVESGADEAFVIGSLHRLSHGPAEQLRHLVITISYLFLTQLHTTVASRDGVTHTDTRGGITFFPCADL